MTITDMITFFSLCFWLCEIQFIVKTFSNCRENSKRWAEFNKKYKILGQGHLTIDIKYFTFNTVHVKILKI